MVEIASTEEEQNFIKSVPDVIEVALFAVEDLASQGKLDEAITLADQTAQAAFNAGYIVLAVKAACEGHRYNAIGKTPKQFKKCRKMLGKAVYRWSRDCSEADITLIRSHLRDLRNYGKDLASNRSA